MRRTVSIDNVENSNEAFGECVFLHSLQNELENHITMAQNNPNKEYDTPEIKI